MSEPDPLRERIAFLESDIDRLRREARERDQVINELFQRLESLEQRLTEQAATSDESDEGERLRAEFFGEARE